MTNNRTISFGVDALRRLSGVIWWCWVDGVIDSIDIFTMNRGERDCSYAYVHQLREKVFLERSVASSVQSALDVSKFFFPWMFTADGK